MIFQGLVVLSIICRYDKWDNLVPSGKLSRMDYVIPRVGRDTMETQPTVGQPVLPTFQTAEQHSAKSQAVMEEVLDTKRRRIVSRLPITELNKTVAKNMEVCGILYVIRDSTTLVVVFVLLIVLMDCTIPERLVRRIVTTEE